MIKALRSDTVKLYRMLLIYIEFADAGWHVAGLLCRIGDKQTQIAHLRRIESTFYNGARIVRQGHFGGSLGNIDTIFKHVSKLISAVARR